MKRALILIGMSSVLIAGAWTSVCRADLNDGLVAYYGFNGNANDLSGHGNDGTICGGPTFTTDHWGNPNGALHFDGVNDYVLLPNEGHFDLTTFTIVMTARVPDYTQINYLIQKGFLGGNYQITVNDSTYPDTAGWPFYLQQVAGGNASNPIAGGPVPSNQYFQLAVTYGPQGYNGYMNGSMTFGWGGAPVPMDYPPVLNDEPVTIGAGGYYNISNFYVGDIDEVRFYDRVLTADQIGALYTQVNPVPVPGAVLLGALGLSLAGWWLKRKTH